VITCTDAGITVSSDGADVAEEDYRRLMAVNLVGTLFSAQAAGERMKALGKQGSIVLMAKALADAFGPHGIRVNSVAPGTIDTELLRSTPGVAEAA
jgi:L-rhamnose 1-dehydrogenase